MKKTTYRVSRSTMSSDPLLACNCGETYLLDDTFATAQTAVDAARAFVKEHSGPDLPRAIVLKVTEGRTPTRTIFRAWLTTDRVYQEERRQA